MDDKIDYFLSLRKKHECILNNLKEIKTTYEEMISLGKLFGRYLNSEIKEMSEYEKKIDETNYIIKCINEKLECVCNHNYIDDIIDISPERSQNITYCTICGHTI